ncbi:hypothetical protein NHX12_000813 [Muraenolepis orangiensis]|uniref:LIM domain-containing protein 1 n=1 Tax=Muraenolepis orangiensis TaxID=630683 RepID=A0A9Q0DYJ5_9TELE|nr:hypothetical protein NHX12_000813 [Muraenolepis orangiensis]
MDKYEDLGLEASKFIEDLNMYEASRDGLFRMRRDAGNNPDFEETRKVFATKMTKIHMQKQQEEMAKNTLAIRMNGAHSSAYYPRDRPPINSSRQASEAAAKPPMLSGPVAPGAGGQHPVVQPEVPPGRAHCDHKEPHYQAHTSHPGPPVSPSWGSSSGGQSYPSPPASLSESSPYHRSPSHSPHSHLYPSLPAKAPAPPERHSPNALSALLVGSTHGVGEPSSSGNPDLLPGLPLSAFTGRASFQLQQPSSVQPLPVTPPPPPTARYSPSAPRPSVGHGNCDHHGPPAQNQGSALTPTPGAEAHPRGKGPGVSRGSPRGQADAEGRGPSPRGGALLPGQALPAPDREPSTAEAKLDVLTQQLEKEMEAQTPTDYFGENLHTLLHNLL